MVDLSSQIDGVEWQAFVTDLLYIRYGADLISIPDKHKGDRGIEAYSLDGNAYQCYSPEGLLPISTTADKHKKKINTDLIKFQVVSKVAPLLGNTKIKRWVLIVPDHCSAEVVSHCVKKTGEIRNVSPPLPYITGDFQVVAVDGHQFLAAEIAVFTSKSGFEVEALECEIVEKDVAKFSEINTESITNLNRKLHKLPTITNEEDRMELFQHLLKMFLEGSNAADYYEARFPAIADKIRFLKQQRAKALKIDSKLKLLTIDATRQAFEAELITSVTNLGRSTAMTLSYAAVTEWLMLCHLDPNG